MICLFIVLACFAIVINVLGLLRDDNACACGFFGSILMLITTGIGLHIWGNKPEPYPTAIDVYRGRTTLEITYRDSVAVDSVVVWKEGMK